MMDRLKITEAKHQENVIEWSQNPRIRAKYPGIELLFHVTNGGSRNKIEAAHLKRQGVKPGVPDLFLPVARGRYHGLFIEMKTDTGRASDAKNDWIERLNAEGYFAEVCHGWESAVRVLERYLTLWREERDD